MDPPKKKKKRPRSSVLSTVRRVLEAWCDRVHPSAARRQAMQDLLEHMEHCLITLSQKQQSLLTAMRVFRDDVYPSLLEQLVAGSHQQPQLDVAQKTAILQHLFQTLLRFHDGLILCISGECRHVGDVQIAQHNHARYRSRLNQQGSRTDGYTQLYSSRLTYSGASWDEWNDPHQGLLHRLVVGCMGKKTNGVDWLLTKAPDLEAYLGQIETRMQDLQEFFPSMEKQLQHDLKTKGIAKQVKLCLLDKMESFQLSFAAQTLKLERRANEFQIHDGTGVLPSLTADEWKPLLQLQTANESKRKRKIILEDSSDDDEPEKAAVRQEEAPIVGLRATTIVAKNGNGNATENEASLAAIKQSMGVDDMQLAEARLELEKEEAEADRIAQAIDAAPVDDDESVEDAMEVAEMKVEHHQRRLRRVTSQNLPIEEQWDYRESLREALMEAGELLLWNERDDDRKADLKRAIEHFEEARRVARAQEVLLQQMVDQGSEIGVDLDFFARSIVRQKALAIAKSGIAYLLMSGIYSYRRHDYLIEARSRLQNSSKLGMALSQQATRAIMTEEVHHERFRIMQLEAISSRWLAKTLWVLKKETESLEVFGRAHDRIQSTGLMNGMPLELDLVEALLDVKVELCLGWSDLVKLISSSLFDSPSSDRSKETTRYTSLRKALDNSSRLCSSLHEIIQTSLFGTELANYLSDHNVPSPAELQSLKAETQRRWNEKQTAPSVDQSEYRASAVGPPRRGELENHGESSGSLPTQMFTIDAAARRRRKKNRFTDGGGSGSARHSATVDDEPRRPSARKYRKWGDELLPQVQNERGEWVPDLKYPSIAPEMPPEIAALISSQ